jgi:5-methylcytosine-specific restriction enzyme A
MIARTMPEGQFQPGNLYKRRDLHSVWGGQQQGGISTPAGADYALLFDDTYGYCGEGQEGDQELVRGNWAIADRSPDIHLFKETKDGLVEYLDQMYYAEHSYEPGVDKNGKPREVVIFKLRKYRPEHRDAARAAKRRGLGQT